MSNLLIATIIGSFAGIVGTGLGGAVSFILHNPSKRLISDLLNFSAGLMLAVVCFDLLPESFEISNIQTGLTGVFIGIVVVILIDHIVSFLMSRMKTNKDRKKSDFLKTGILLGIGIAIHNFPEGLAIGSGLTAVQTYGIGLILVMAIHDVPEGIAMSAPMTVGGMSSFKAFLSAVIAGIPTGIGAFLGYLLGEISASLISISMGFAAGAMLYITCSELLPESYAIYRGKDASFVLIVGIITGLIITSIL